MKRKIKPIILLLTISFLLTGCFNRREVDAIAIAVGLGIDKIDDGFEVTVQLINPGEIAVQNTASRSPVTVFSVQGKTVFEALRRMTMETPRKIFLSHFRIVVFGEELAREGIAKTLDFLIRDHEIRMDYYLIVAKDATASELLSVLTPLEKIPAHEMHTSVETSERVWAPTKSVKIDELVTSLMSDGKEAVLSGMVIDGNPKHTDNVENLKESNLDTIIRYESLGVYKKDKLVGWMDQEESKGFNYIMGNVENTVGYVDIPDGDRVAVEIISTESKIDVSVKNGKPVIHIYVSFEFNIAEVEFDFDVTKQTNIEILESLAKEKNERRMIDVVDKVQKKYEADIFGFGEAVHKKYPRLWKEIKNDWDNTFKDISVYVHSNAKLKGVGTSSKTFLEKVKG